MSEDVESEVAIPPPIKFIICLDGTSNSDFIENIPPTNVSRIRQCILPNGYDNTRQITFYRSGVGTGYRNPLNALHQANGDGIRQIVIEAYRFLCDNYYDNSDEIFLIGFSRGAFAARCLADLISKYGLMRAGEIEHVQQLYHRWSTQANVPVVPEYRPCQIKACTLWDTVSALGIPLPGGIVMRHLPFIHSEIPNTVGTTVEHTFQGLALHEHRFHFFPIVLKPQGQEPPGQKLEQCWFAGYHADVGGGQRRDALAHFALVWTMVKLSEWIRFDTTLLPQVTPNDTWRVGRPSPRIGSTLSTYLVESVLATLSLPFILRAALSECQLTMYIHFEDRLPVIDSMRWGFLAGGSKYRIPQTEFWNQSGTYRTQIATQETRERMHATTRFLTEQKLVKPFYSAVALPTCRTEPNWQWTLRSFSRSWVRWPWRKHRQQNAGNNTIDEEQIQTAEIKMLHSWACVAHDAFDEEDHDPGEELENMVLVRLKDWLETCEPYASQPS